MTRRMLSGGVLLAAVAGFAFAGRAGADFPPLYGDGVHDDAPAIQARLDSGATLVYLPSPAKEYLISTTLVIRSRTELKLDRFARVRLAPNASCPLLTNADPQKGDRDIAVTGGIWDMDNLRQSPNPWVRADGSWVSWSGHAPRLLSFDNIVGFSLRGVTLRNPAVYNCQLRRVSFFTVEDVTFEQDTWNPFPINMDGINLHGGCHHGRIANLRGLCFDDMVAINAHDPVGTPYHQPITDIDVDGLYSDFTHRGVRIYNTGQPVKRITVRNVHIRTYRNAVAITQFRPQEPRAVFDDIVIRDIQSSATYEPEELYNDKTAWPIIWVERKCDVGHLVIDNVSRTETCRAAHPTIGIDEDATVEHLVIRDCRQVNETKDDMVFLTVHGKVEKLELGEVSLKSAPGAGRNILRDDAADCGWLFRNFTPNVRPATDIYLLLGQSNMAGRGILTPSNRVSTVRVRSFANGEAWYPAREPIVLDKGAFHGACIGAQFGREMADADPKAVIGLIPAAVGNTKLARWEPGGDLYNRAVEWTRKALERGGTVKGILWHQGEADAGNEREVATYATRLKGMVAALRKEFGDVPFVAGELGHFLDTLGDISEKKTGHRSCRLWKEVNAQLKRAVAEIPNAALVGAEGLGDKGDHLHFSTEALRVFGRRYAEAMRRLSGKSAD